MINKTEIDAKATEYEINPPDVERDYVYGWLLFAIYSASPLGKKLVLKGGNGFRKGYFETTRYSGDLDFSTTDRIVPDQFKAELNAVCDVIHVKCGVTFEKEKIAVNEKRHSDEDQKIFEARLYFKDFYGKPGNVVIRVKIDLSEFDKIYLPIQNRNLIHPYSDSGECRTEIRCQKLEEMLASKLVCLLQRKHSFDLFDLIYSVFINRTLAVDRLEIASVFLKKTIFSRYPGVARSQLLGLPLHLLKGAWEKYIVCPKQSIFTLEAAVQNFAALIQELFSEDRGTYGERFFYPIDMRNLILDAGSNFRLLRVTYDGTPRLVEPYSLSYKRRMDGVAQEYFYVWDRTGGRSSGPGLKSFLSGKVGSIQSTDEKFEPRHTVELSKSVEATGEGYFSRGFSGGGRGSLREFSSKPFVVECPYCGKRFPRSNYDTKLNKHKDRFGNFCYGRVGTIA